MTTRDNLQKLSANEITVLKMKCEGKKYSEIAEELNYSLEWVQLQMSNVYVKLGFSKETHWTQRARVLKEDVCPQLEEVTEEITEEPTQPRPDPEMMAIVLQDETALLKQEVEEHITPITPRRIPTRALTFLGLIFAGGFCLALILGGVGLWIWNNRIPAIPTTNTATFTATTPPLSPTPPEVSPVVPTETLLSSPLPSPTISATLAFYDEKHQAILKDGVVISIDNDFMFENFAGCITQKPGFVVKLRIRNQTGEQFLIRFDPTAFHAVDDTGKEYELVASGVNRCDAVGPQNIQGRSEEIIYLSFSGEIPLSATYIDITADSISGVRLVFRKGL